MGAAILSFAGVGGCAEHWDSYVGWWGWLGVFSSSLIIVNVGAIRMTWNHDSGNRFEQFGYVGTFAKSGCGLALSRVSSRVGAILQVVLYGTLLCG